MNHHLRVRVDDLIRDLARVLKLDPKKIPVDQWAAAGLEVQQFLQELEREGKYR